MVRSPYSGDTKKFIPGLHVEKVTFLKVSDFRPYYKHYLEKGSKKLGEKDGSRIDAEITLRMRLDGYDASTSINTILNESEWAKQRTTGMADSNMPDITLVFLLVWLVM